MKRLLPLLVLVFVTFTALRAEALTVRDIIDLSKAGLGEEVLLALVEVDGGIFTINNETLLALKAAGVPEKVIVAMVKSGRTPRPQDVPPVVVQAPQPTVVVVERPDPVYREVAVPVPVYVPVETVRRVYVSPDHGRNVHRESPSLITIPRTYRTDTPQPPSRQPVYWGHDGKLRPDAWKPR